MTPTTLPLLSLRGISKRFVINNQERYILKDISFDIYPGEIFGLLGANGAGKTTLSSILAAIHPPSQGSIVCGGIPLHDHVIEYKHFLGFCPQKVQVITWLTVFEQLMFAGRFYGLSKAEAKKRAEVLMERYNLLKYRNEQIPRLSGGYKQRLIIARALMHNPRFLILDEPTVGLDPQIRAQLWNEIRDLKKEGVTILLTTHYLDEADSLCDHICILHRGCVRLVGIPTTLKATYQRARLEDVFLALTQDDLPEEGGLINDYSH